MIFLNYLKLFFKMIYKSRRVFIFISLILTFFSFINLSIISIAFSYEKNLKNMNKEIMRKEGSTISLQKSYDDFTEYEISYIYNNISKDSSILKNIFSTKTGVIYFDYDFFYYDELKIENNQYIYKGSNYTFLNNKKTDYKVGDSIEILGNNYIVGGFYDSDIFVNPICDMTYSSDIGFKNITIEYNNYNNTKNNIEKFINLYDKLKKLEESSSYLSVSSYYNDKYNKTNINASKIRNNILIIDLILILFMIGIIITSFSILKLDNEKYISLIYCLGSRKSRIRLMVLFEYLLLSIISILLSFIIILIFNPLYSNIISYLLNMFEKNICIELKGLYDISFNTNFLSILILMIFLILISIIFSFKNKYISRGEI